MIENGFIIDKTLIPRAKIFCPLHSRENINFVCTEIKCNKCPMICEMCKAEDESH